MIRLNSVPRSVFDAREIDNTTVKLNSAEGKGKGKELSRREIVSLGRLAACEHFGHEYNRRPDAIEKYKSRLNNEADYATLSRKFNEQRLLFCAAKTADSYGTEAPKTFEDFKTDAMSYGSDPMFVRLLGAIDRDVISPIFFDVLSDVGMGLLQIETVPLGGVKEITVRSNDVFRMEDSDWGSARSASRNMLYSKTLTLTPHPYVCGASIKWYQDVVNGDAGWYYNAIFGGMYSKMYAILMSVLKKATAGNTYIPTGLTASTYTSSNWTKITDLVAAVNGVSVNELMAIGTRSALQNVLPVDGTGAAIVGLQYGLGETWFENGYLPKAGGIDLFPVTPAVVPGTQNSTIDTIDTGNNIYIMAKGGYGYKPIYAAVPEGSPIMLTATPNAGNALGTADLTIDINVQAMFDFKPVFATKVGVITSVYPSA